jgi:hypothetical protein
VIDPIIINIVEAFPILIISSILDHYLKSVRRIIKGAIINKRPIVVKEIIHAGFSWASQ